MTSGVRVAQPRWLPPIVDHAPPALRRAVQASFQKFLKNLLFISIFYYSYPYLLHNIIYLECEFDKQHIFKKSFFNLNARAHTRLQRHQGWSGGGGSRRRPGRARAQRLLPLCRVHHHHHHRKEKSSRPGLSPLLKWAETKNGFFIYFLYRRQPHHSTQGQERTCRLFTAKSKHRSVWRSNCNRTVRLHNPVHKIIRASKSHCSS